MEKGSTIKGVLDFVKEKFGEETLISILKEFPENVQKELKFILTFRWYPVEYFIDLLNAVCKKCFNGDPSKADEIGKYLLKTTLPTIYKVFYKFGNPMFIIKRAPVLWKMYHKTGKMEVKQTGKKSIEVTVSDYAIPNKVHCYVIKGGMEMALELSGAKEVEAKENECVCEGAPHCRYEVKWK